jgi:hypothetical protein
MFSEALKKDRNPNDADTKDEGILPCVSMANRSKIVFTVSGRKDEILSTKYFIKF